MGSDRFRISILLRLAVMTLVIFVALYLVADWMGPELIKWFAGRRGQTLLSTQDARFLFGLGAILIGLVSGFVVENMPTGSAPPPVHSVVHSSLTSGLIMISFISVGIILVVSTILGY